MITPNDIKLLHNLIAVPSPSGHEKNVSEFIEHQLLQIGVSQNEITIDKHYNVIVKFNEGCKKTVLIDAHSDTIGFAINNVDRWGSISLKYLGSGDSTILSARHLDILTKNGIIPAVIDRKHAHLVYDEDAELIYSPEQADVDIGIRDRDKVLKIIKTGDPVVYHHNFRELTKSYFTGYGLDDKSGCFILLNTIENLLKSRVKPDVNLVFVFSTQEEIASKLPPVIRAIRPDLIIELDVTFATDYGAVDELEREVGRCELNKGIVVLRGTGIDEECRELAMAVAKTRKIPYQVQVNTQGDYTSQSISQEAPNANAMVFGIPLRNMHCPDEIINMNDLITGSNLLKYFLVNKKLKGLI